MQEDKKFEKWMVVCVILIFIGLFYIVFVGLLLARPTITEEFYKNRPKEEVVDQEERADVESIQGIAQEEAEEPIRANKYMSVETLEEQNEKAVSEHENLKNIIFEICSQYDNVRPELVLAMIETESTYNPNAENGDCIGLMQVNRIIHADRARKLEVTNLFDPWSNVLTGVDYFSDLMTQYDNDEEKALVAYNCGHYTGNVTSYATKILNRSYELANE